MDTVHPWAGRFDAERLSLTKRKTAYTMWFCADAGIDVQLVNICDFCSSIGLSTAPFFFVKGIWNTMAQYLSLFLSPYVLGKIG